MQNLLKRTLICLLIIAISGCDDGDIILNEDLNFEIDDLQFCNINNSQGTPQSTVFFNINSDTNEVLSFEINNGSFIPTRESVEALETRPVEQLNLTLRDFDSNITSNYFCSGIPDSSIQILTELQGTSGNIQIQTRNITTLNGDDDQDGLTNADEGLSISSLPNATQLPDGFIILGTDLSNLLDTDEDGIPNFRDQDDDNDNVFTSLEIDSDSETEEVIFTDTDGDTIPDYLDPDDDNDGVLTRNEITQDGPSPTSNQNQSLGIFHYLNDQVSNEIISDTQVGNTFTNIFRTSVIGSFISFSDGVSTITRDKLDFGEFDTQNQDTNDEIEGSTM